jgi:hypothetical protein
MLIVLLSGLDERGFGQATGMLKTNGWSARASLQDQANMFTDLKFEERALPRLPSRNRLRSSIGLVADF